MVLRRKLLFSGVVLFVLSCSSLVVSVEASSMWSRTYGGTGDELAWSLVATSDGGYAIAGWTDSFGTGDADFWLVKTDSNGVMEWNRTYGGTKSESLFTMVKTSDEGYAIAGSTMSFGSVYRSFWLVKTDSNGAMEWNRTYAQTMDNVANSLVATSDGGYAIAGSAISNQSYCWLVKTDALGNMLWNRTYVDGGVSSLVAMSDGGYALAGSTSSFGAGLADFWLVKTDPFGNMQWNRTYGGTGIDIANSLVATSDGGYALVGTWDYYSPIIFAYLGYSSLVNSDMLGNKRGNKTHALAGSAESSGAGSNDIWLVKTDSNGVMEWNRTYGEGDAHSLVATSDGGYAIAGRTISNQSYCWLVKTDPFGNMEWSKTYESGIAYWTDVRSLVATPDGGYALAGYIYYPIALNSDFWLAKTDEFGVFPEYSSWFIPALVLTATAFIIINKKKLLHKHG
jgi:archaellin